MITPKAHQKSQIISSFDCFCGFFWIRESGTPYYKWFSSDYYHMKWNQEDLFFSGFLSALNSSGEVFFDGDILNYVEFKGYKIFLSQIANGDVFALISTKECSDTLALHLLENLTEYFFDSRLTQSNTAATDSGKVDSIFRKFYSRTIQKASKIVQKNDLTPQKRKPHPSLKYKRTSMIPHNLPSTLELELQLGSMSKLTRTLGHEINNILGTILGNISLARMESASTDENEENLYEAEVACQQARTLTSQLLNITKTLGKNTKEYSSPDSLPTTAEKAVQRTIKDSVTNIKHGSGSILVLDDDLAILHTTKKMLTHIGYTVTVADTLQKALTLYQKRFAKGVPFDVVILDLSELGGLGGFGALIWQKIDPNINAIVSSGYANDPVFQQYEQHGFRAVLKKPYDLSTLSWVLSESLEYRTQ